MRRRLQAASVDLRNREHGSAAPEGLKPLIPKDIRPVMSDQSGALTLGALDLIAYTPIGDAARRHPTNYKAG